MGQEVVLYAVASPPCQTMQTQSLIPKGINGPGGRPTCTREPTMLYEVAQDAILRGHKWTAEQPEAGVSLPKNFNPSTCWGLAYKVYQLIVLLLNMLMRVTRSLHNPKSLKLSAL
jgi:hypothetical protein